MKFQSLTHTLAQRIGRFLERKGLLERDVENSCLASDATEEGPMDQLLGHSITYRIDVDPQQGHKVFTLQTLPACDSDEQLGKVARFSLHAGVAMKAHQRDKLERLCRYITRSAISEKRLSLTSNGKVRYELKTPWRDGIPRMFSSSLWTLQPGSLPWYPNPELTSLASMVSLLPIANSVHW